VHAMSGEQKNGTINKKTDSACGGEWRKKY